MSKRIYIHSVDMNQGRSYVVYTENYHIEESLYLTIPEKHEYPNIYLDHEVTDEEFANAINTIVTAFMQRRLKTMYIDLDKRNEKLAPVKEMTLEEIEKELGYKVKVINKNI